jgi:hypothetical protein
MGLQDATSEPAIRVAEYCLVINQWPLLLWPTALRGHAVGYVKRLL